MQICGCPIGGPCAAGYAEPAECEKRAEPLAEELPAVSEAERLIAQWRAGEIALYDPARDVHLIDDRIAAFPPPYRRIGLDDIVRSFGHESLCAPLPSPTDRAGDTLSPRVFRRFEVRAEGGELLGEGALKLTAEAEAALGKYSRQALESIEERVRGALQREPIPSAQSLAEELRRMPVRSRFMPHRISREPIYAALEDEDVRTYGTASADAPPTLAELSEAAKRLGLCGHGTRRTYDDRYMGRPIAHECADCRAEVEREAGRRIEDLLLYPHSPILGTPTIPAPVLTFEEQIDRARGEAVEDAVEEIFEAGEPCEMGARCEEAAQEPCTNCGRIACGRPIERRVGIGDAGATLDYVGGAGDARCNFCDGPMPCYCEALPKRPREDAGEGRVCGDRSEP